MKPKLRLLGLLALVVSLSTGCKTGPIRPEASTEAFADHLDNRVPALLNHYCDPDADTTFRRSVRVH